METVGRASMAEHEETTGLRRLATLFARWRPLLRHAVALAVVLAIAFLLLSSSRSNLLTSDESLYLSEGFNIATGRGLTYTSGEPIVHRPPLFPALLATDFKLAGLSLDNAYWVPRIFTILSAMVLYFLGLRLFNFWAGFLAASLAMGSSYLNYVGGTNLFLDGTLAFFVLLSLALLVQALESDRGWWFAAAGTALGLAFLVKETALAWAPLVVITPLLFQRYRTVACARGVALYMAGFVAVTGWWFAWVYAETRDLYAFRLSTRTTFLLAGLVLALLVVAGVLLLLRARSLKDVGRLVVRLGPAESPLWPVAGLVLLIAWALVSLRSLEAGSTEFVTHNYFDTVPDYFQTIVSSNVQPYYAVLAAWALVLVAAVRGHRQSGLLVVALVLFLPIIVFVGNREWEIRQITPAIYLSYLALGAVGGAFLAWLGGFLRERTQGLRTAGYLSAAALLAVFGVFLFDQQQDFRDRVQGIDRQAVRVDDWDNPQVHRVANWMEENIPGESRILTSRLYFSHLYFLTGGRNTIIQLPTVRVEVNAGNETPLTSVGTLHRHENHLMGPPRPENHWLYLKKYPHHGFWVALSEEDLLSALRDREPDYVIISGEDAGYSSLTYLDYFIGNPAFELLYSDRPSGGSHVYVFKVDRERLQPRRLPTTMDSYAFFTLLDEASDDEAYQGPAQLLRGISNDGVRIAPKDDRSREAEKIIDEVYGVHR